MSQTLDVSGARHDVRALRRRGDQAELEGSTVTEV